MSESGLNHAGQRSLWRRLGVGAPLVLCALGGALLARLGGVQNISAGVFILALTLGLLLQILIHEAGHVLLGLRAGLRLATLAVGPLHYEPGRGLRWRPSPLLGFALLVPPPGMGLVQITSSFRQMVMGGPAAGLLLSALFALLALTLPGQGFRQFFAVSAVLGGILNLLSVVPMAGSGVLNDGARYQRLRPGAPYAGAEAALMALISLARTSRPRDWPPELLAASQQPLGTPTFDGAARQFAAAQAIDSGDLGRAAELQQQASELASTLPPALRAGFSAEEVFLLALRDQAAEARAQFDRLPRSALVPRVTHMRALAAVLLAEGHVQDARITLEHARQDLGSPLASRGIEAAFLDELELRLRAAARSSA